MPRRALWTLFVLGIAGFVALALAYDDEPLRSVDADVARWVAGNMPGWLEALARPFSWLGGWIGITVLSIAVLVLLLRERNWLDLGFLFAAVVGSQVVVTVLKAWFDRPRPTAGTAVPLPQSPAFPSGHATSAIACLGAFAVLATERLPESRTRRRVWAALALAGVGVGLSRIVLNVHFVTDVLAGWCLGLAWLSGCLLVRHSLRRPADGQLVRHASGRDTSGHTDPEAGARRRPRAGPPPGRQSGGARAVRAGSP